MLIFAASIRFPTSYHNKAEVPKVKSYAPAPSFGSSGGSFLPWNEFPACLGVKLGNKPLSDPVIFLQINSLLAYYYSLAFPFVNELW